MQNLPRKRFATTHWSVVLAASEKQTESSRRALETLCRDYWYPVYSYIRRRGHEPETAADLTQGFFARMLEKEAFRLADPERGRFRSFLLTSLKNYLTNEWERQQAKKRGAGAALLSLDYDRGEQRLRFEVASPVTPEKLFDRDWAHQVLDRALGVLEEEMNRAGDSRKFRLLVSYLTTSGRQTPYKEVAGKLASTEGAVKVAVHRMRKRFGAIVRSELANTLGSAEHVDGELKYLLEAVSNP
jgi:RNA polymerase sigma-70 factor (ECF subfamily)